MSLLVNSTMRKPQPVDELGTGALRQGGPVDSPTVPRHVPHRPRQRRARSGPASPDCSPAASMRSSAACPACGPAWTPTAPGVPEDSRSGPSAGSTRSRGAVCSAARGCFELFTCRNCGSAYARAYTDNVQEPRIPLEGARQRFVAVAGHVERAAPDRSPPRANPRSMRPSPPNWICSPGRLNPREARRREPARCSCAATATPAPRADGERRAFDAPAASSSRAAVCGEQAAYGRSSVQDHQTKGDQPFQALVTRQIEVQPPSAKPLLRLRTAARPKGARLLGLAPDRGPARAESADLLDARCPAPGASCAVARA